MNTEYFALAVMTVMAIGFITEIVPISVTAMAACLSFAIAGIIPFKAAFSGFASDTIMLIAGSMIVGASLVSTGCTSCLGRAVVRTLGRRERPVLAFFMTVGGIMSMFISNSGMMAMLLPIMRSVSASSGGAIRTLHLAIPIGMALLAGGISTLVGSSPQLISQSFLESNHLPVFSMFELGFFGIPSLFVIILFFTTVGYPLLLRATKDLVCPTEHLVASTKTQDAPLKKKIIALGILIFMVAGFVTHIWTIGAVAVFSALLCMSFRCINAKDAYKKIDWSSIIVIASCFGISKGMTASGGAAFLARSVIQVIGENPDPLLFIAVIGLFCMLIGNLMSHTALLALIIPLLLPVAFHFGIDGHLLIFALTGFVASAYMSPLGGASYSMALTEGYRFSSYIVLGAVPTVLCFAIVLGVTYLRLAWGF